MATLSLELHEELRTLFVDQFDPPFSGTVDEWAKENIDLPNGFFAVKGSFDVSISNYLRQPMADLTNPDVSQINCIAASQSGKSLLSQIYLPYVITQCPSPTMILAQTDEAAYELVEKRLRPIFDNCKPIRDMLSSNNLVVKKGGITLPLMPIRCVAAKESVLHGPTIQILIMDEAHLFDVGVIKKAKLRTTAFGKNKKIIIASTPGIEGDQLSKEDTGLSYTWGWRCPECKELQPYHWSKLLDNGVEAGKVGEDGNYAGICWDKVWIDKEAGTYDMDKTAATSKLYCEHCYNGLEDTDANRRYLNETGEYILLKDSGDHAVKTYNWCAFVNQKITFKEKAIEYMQAVKDKKANGQNLNLKTFIQQVLGQTYSPQKFVDQTQVLVSSFEPDAAWPEQVFKTLTVDYQQVWGMKFYTVCAFSPTEIRVLDHGFVLKWDDIAAIAEKYKIPPPAVGVDSGYNAKEVYAESFNRAKLMNFAKRAPEKVGWTCLKGDDRDEGYKHKMPNGEILIRYYSPMSKPAITNNQFTRLFEWSNSYVKNALYHIKEGKSTMKLVLPSPDPEFTKQMNSETLQEVIDAKTGLRKTRWKKMIDDNHYWDCICQAIVMCMMAGKFGEEPNRIGTDIQKNK